MQVLVWHKKPQGNPVIMKQRRNTFSHCRQILPDMKAFVFDFQSMPDVQNLALQHSLTNTIPALLFNLRATATRVMNPIATDSIHKLSAGGHSSAVDWHPDCPRNPFSRPRGYPGSSRKMGKCVFRPAADAATCMTAISLLIFSASFKTYTAIQCAQHFARLT